MLTHDVAQLMQQLPSWLIAFVLIIVCEIPFPSKIEERYLLFENRGNFGARMALCYLCLLLRLDLSGGLPCNTSVHN